MDRIFANARLAHRHTGILVRIIQQLRRMARQQSDARRLATMPRDRLADMGIPQRTEINRRSSGEAGAINNLPQW
jgi:uncharacterized protein YjiS (DUF1127 family)